MYQAIIIFKDSDGIEDGGIFNNISYKTAAAEIGENNILFYIPLTISGRTYNERKNDLRNKAIDYQNTWCDFCGFSYGELAIIQDFFETNGRRYGLLTDFKENAIC